MMAGPGKGSPEVTKLEQALEELEGGSPLGGGLPRCSSSQKEAGLESEGSSSGIPTGQSQCPTHPALLCLPSIGLSNINSEPGGAPRRS